MALLEETFRDMTLDVSAVSSLIGDRMSPIFLKAGETLPAATYRRSGTRFENETLEDEAIEYPHMEVVLWGLDYAPLKTAMAALKTALRTGLYADPIAAIAIVEEEDVFDKEYPHADGIGLPGVRLECELTLVS